MRSSSPFLSWDIFLRSRLVRSGLQIAADACSGHPAADQRLYAECVAESEDGADIVVLGYAVQHACDRSALLGKKVVAGGLLRRNSQASRSSRPSRSLSTTPRAGSCARRCRPGTTGRETPAGIFAVIARRTRTTTRASMRCLDAGHAAHHPGTASRCTAGRCRGMQPRTGACGCPTTLRRSCSIRRGSGCG